MASLFFEENIDIKTIKIIKDKIEVGTKVL